MGLLVLQDRLLTLSRLGAADELGRWVEMHVLACGAGGLEDSGARLAGTCAGRGAPQVHICSRGHQEAQGRHPSPGVNWPVPAVVLDLSSFCCISRHQEGMHGDNVLLYPTSQSLYDASKWIMTDVNMQCCRREMARRSLISGFRHSL